MKYFLCWLKYGHCWATVGAINYPDGKATMFQCAHCAMTVIFDNVSGKCH